jgi:hypothetical protein
LKRIADMAITPSVTEIFLKKQGCGWI